MTTMPAKYWKRRFWFLMTSSVVALGATCAPVSLDAGFHHSIEHAAMADSCFAAGTRVLMADSSEKPIELIEIGDRVMGLDGATNRVVAIERPRLGGRGLYALGGGRHFVTPEHPFFTRAGWKAIDPVATRSENPSLAVGRLRAFDEVAVARFDIQGGSVGNLALALPLALTLAYRPVGRITACAADPLTLVYNLILDGDHTYFADGFLVHNKDGGSGSGGSGSGGSGSGSGGSGSGGDGGGSSGSSGEGGSSGSGEGGSSGSSGEGGSSGSSGEGGDAGSGHSGDDGGQAGEAASGQGGSIGGVSQKGPDLSRAQEAEAIAKGWK